MLRVPNITRQHVVLASKYHVGPIVFPSNPKNAFTLDYTNFPYAVLLSLVCDLHDLRSITQSHSRSILLCTDSSRLGFIFNESNPSSTRHQTNFPKSLESTKYSRQSINIIFLWQVLYEENFIRWQVFIRDDSSTSRIGGFESSSASGFDGSNCLVGRQAYSSGSLEALLLFCSFGGPLLICPDALAC